MSSAGSVGPARARVAKRAVERAQAIGFDGEGDRRRRARFGCARSTMAIPVLPSPCREELMKLEAEGQPAIVDPRRDEVESTVTRLSLPDRTFLVLSRSRTSYVQVGIVGPNRLVLECQEGNAGQRFQYARDDISAGEAIEILEAYRSGKESWRNENDWRRTDATAYPDGSDRMSLLVAIIGLLLMLESAGAFLRGGTDPLFGRSGSDVFTTAVALMMLSAIIDLRKFRTMTVKRRVRPISTLAGGALIVAIQLFDRFTTR